MPKFRVELYFSTFFEKEVEAQDKKGALKIAAEKIDEQQILNNIEPWEECDTVEQIKENDNE